MMISSVLNLPTSFQAYVESSDVLSGLQFWPLQIFITHYCIAPSTKHTARICKMQHRPEDIRIGHPLQN